MNVLREARLDNRKVEATLHLARPFGRTLVYSLFLLALLLGVVELLAQSRFFKAHVIANDWGTIHNQFEVQLGRLETVAANTGSVECIFMGSSMVWHAFDPGTFYQVYNERTGQKMRCFNFGIDGGVASTAGALAPILVENYRPQYLVFGTDARDYAVPIDARDATLLLESPWVRYRQGFFTLRGWFYEHIHLSRAWESLGHLVRLQKTYLMVPGASSLDDTLYGFRPYDTVADYVMTSPLEHMDMQPVRYYRDLLLDYQILPENLQGLQAIAALKDSGTEVIFVEMPIPETYLDFFGNSEKDYELFLTTVQEVADAAEIPFLRTRPLGLIPADGWMDYTHVNSEGARRFSRWLAERMAQQANAHEADARVMASSTGE